MKKYLLLSFVFLALAASAETLRLRVVPTACEDDLAAAYGYDTNDQDAYEELDWAYFGSEGIDKTAASLVDRLPAENSSVLYGISQGGVVSRRMAQIALERGRTDVKGYITQSSPLEGDRLANKAWATWSVASLVYTSAWGLVWSFPDIFFSMAEAALGGVAKGEADSLAALDATAAAIDERSTARLGEKERNLARAIEAGGRNRAEYRGASRETVARDLGLPLLDAISGEGRASNFLNAVFGSDYNNVKDLDPKSDFMTGTLNGNASRSREKSSGLKRAFITSSDGDVFESPAWSYVGPFLNSLYQSRASYWAKAKRHWWAFPYWALRAAMKSVTIGSVEGLPRAWSASVAGIGGAFDYSRHDGFVANRDSFGGHELRMTAPDEDMRTYDLDRKFECPHTSHMDYGKSLAELRRIQGRTYSRGISAEEQINAFIGAVNFMKGGQ